MSKKRDRERAAAGEVFRNVSKKMTRCPVPNCPGVVVAANSANGLCPKHEEFLESLLFFLPRIRVEQAKTPGGLVLPGQGFVPEAVIKDGRFKP